MINHIHQMEYLIKQSQQRDSYRLHLISDHYDDIHDGLLELHEQMPNSCIRTFALAIDLFCAFVTQLDKQLGSKKTHLIKFEKHYETSIACLFIATKFEDVYPVSAKKLLRLYLQQQGQPAVVKQLAVDHLLEIERCVLQVLEFNTSKVLFVDFCNFNEQDPQHIYNITKSITLCELQPHIQFANMCRQLSTQQLINLIDMQPEEFQQFALN